MDAASVKRLTVRQKRDLSFRRAVILDPGDPAPRLVYADWLAEEGDEFDQMRADFIRAQVALERDKISDLDVARCERTVTSVVGRWPPWLSPWRDEPPTCVARGNGTYHGLTLVWYPGPEDEISVLWRGGFLHYVCCPWGRWRAEGPRLVRLHPLAKVFISGASPWLTRIGPAAGMPGGGPPGLETYSWWLVVASGPTPITTDQEEPFHPAPGLIPMQIQTGLLPEALWTYLSRGTLIRADARRYDDPQEALDDLSAAALLWARLRNASLLPL